MTRHACTLCNASADPRLPLLTRDGRIFALCHGCSPEKGDERVVADRCRATRLPPVGHIPQEMENAE